MIDKSARIGENTIIHHPELVNIYGCTIGNNCTIGAFVEINQGVTIGNNVKIGAFVFIPDGVTIEDNVFIGPHACFTNDKQPKATDKNGNLLQHGEWEMKQTLVKQAASIGANATIICGITIGEHALVGAGSVVTKDVSPDTIVAGNPARIMKP